MRIKMKCFITGASGFIGANLACELAARGHSVTALVRAGSDLRGLKGIDCEIIQGDILDFSWLTKAMRGSDWCFHLAASYHLWLKDYRPMYLANIEGTRTVLEAAHGAGCSKIVYTSTVGCIGVPEDRNGSTIPSDETASSSESAMVNDYKRSKWRAECVARELVAKGLPVVIVNPSAPVGPRDTKPTPTGGIVLDFLNEHLPAYVDTGLNWVHVRDVAIGHILAAEKGRIGERYILGNAEGNWTMKKALDTLEELTGIAAPKLRLPYPLALMTAYVNEGFSRVSGVPPRAPLAGVRMAKYKMFFSPAKAVKELGMPQTPPKQALADAVEWFQANGYVKNQMTARLSN